MIKKSDDLKFDFVSHKKIDKTNSKYDELVKSIKENYDFCLREKNMRVFVKTNQYYALVFTEKYEEVVGKIEELSMYLRYVEPGVEDD